MRFPQKYESKYEGGAMPSFELGGGIQQPKYDTASPPAKFEPKFEPKYEPNLSQKFEPNLSMENTNSGQQQQQQQHVVGGEGRTGLGEVPPARNMLVAAPENNSISMAMMQWDFQKTQKLMQTNIIMILNTETL